ncbi:hypothetical protein CRG98_032753 [Punica granatum]|uniref:Uncharacterized protein n=1 Tax=Punica granatum TaxID=22663 RepID=A0A2I0IS80_PUNGR|nr:hypothetical protein CRG98_032753 [Punica granatum]
MTVPVYAWFSVLLGEPLTMDGGSRLKGVNSLKSSEDLWGPVRWHSRLDPFPYSEPLTNLVSYIGARGISDKISGKRRKAVNKQASKQTGLSPNPLKSPVESPSCAHPNFISSGHACAMPMQRGLGVSTFPGTRDGRTSRGSGPINPTVFERTDRFSLYPMDRSSSRVISKPVSRAQSKSAFHIGRIRSVAVNQG